MSTTPRAIVVNGEEREVPGDCTVARLLDELEVRGRKVAVALNRNVVPRSRYTSTALASGDRIEILEAVGGG